MNNPFIRNWAKRGEILYLIPFYVFYYVRLPLNSLFFYQDFFTTITHITNVNVEEFFFCLHPFFFLHSLVLSPEPIMLNNCLCVSHLSLWRWWQNLQRLDFLRRSWILLDVTYSDIMRLSNGLFSGPHQRLVTSPWAHYILDHNCDWHLKTSSKGSASFSHLDLDIRGNMTSSHHWNHQELLEDFAPQTVTLRPPNELFIHVIERTILRHASTYPQMWTSQHLAFKWLILDSVAEVIASVFWSTLNPLP